MQPSLDTHQRTIVGPQLPAGYPQVELEITRGNARSKLRRIDQPVYLIGTSPDCDMVLGDPQFADVHAYLMVDCSEVTLRHIACGPEVTVNGSPVRQAILLDQARIRTGSYEFRIHIRAPRLPRPPIRLANQPRMNVSSGVAGRRPPAWPHFARRVSA